jgi:hypothetical protein
MVDAEANPGIAARRHHEISRSRLRRTTKLCRPAQDASCAPAPADTGKVCIVFFGANWTARCRHYHHRREHRGKSDH